MPVTVEQVNVLVTAEVDKALKDLKKVQNAPQKVELSFVKMAKAIAGPAAAGLIINTMKNIAVQSSKLAASADEIQSKFNVVFGDTAKEVNEWASTYSDAVGRSETDTLNFLGTIGDTLKPLGFAKDAVDDMSKQVVELAGDLGSFNNIPTEEVIAGIQSALVGNVETLRRYGVVANETSIKQEAINSGLWDGVGALTAQEKAQAILNITMRGTTDAQGDLERTQDSTANTMIRLNSATKDLQIQLGKSINEGVTPLASGTANLVKELSEWIEKTREANTILADLNETGKVTSTDTDFLTEAINKQKVALTAAENELKNYQASGGEIPEVLEDFNQKINEENELLIKLQNQLTKTQTGFDLVGDSIEQAALLGNEAALEEIRLRQLNLFNLGKENEAYLLLADRRQEALSEDEKRIALLQGQIDEWAKFRDIPGVQELINDLVRERNELQKDGIPLVQEQITWDEIQADIQLRNLLKVAEERAKATEAEVEQAEEVAKAWDSAYSDITSSAMNFFSAIDALATAQGDAELARLKEQGASEEELEQKKKEIARDQAKRKKALGLLNVGIDTASAIIGFLADPGGIPGIALSALAGVTGAVQAAAIAATPLPALAEGGSFTTNGPTPLLVGDNVGGQERVTVEPVSSNGANVRNGMPNGPIALVVDGKQFTAHFQRQIDNRNIRSSKGGAI